MEEEEKKNQVMTMTQVTFLNSSGLSLSINSKFFQNLSKIYPNLIQNFFKIYPKFNQTNFGYKWEKLESAALPSGHEPL